MVMAIVSLELLTYDVTHSSHDSSHFFLTCDLTRECDD